jgi:hypothetical protein
MFALDATSGTGASAYGGTGASSGGVGFNGLGLLNAFVSSMGQYAQANAQYEQQLAAIESTKRSMDDEYNLRVARATLQQQQAAASMTQANDAAAMQSNEVTREMMRAREAALASAQAAGVAGNTLNRLTADISYTQSQKLAAIELSRGNQNSEQLMQQQNAIQETKMKPFRYSISEPNVFNSMFSLLPAALGAFGAWGASGCNTTTGAAIASTATNAPYTYGAYDVSYTKYAFPQNDPYMSYTKYASW